ncbi:MAG: vWA domain-containing protein [Myxococcota bacterium]
MLRRACTLALVATACGRTPSLFSQDDVGGDGTSTSVTLEGSSGQINCQDDPDQCVAELSLRRAVDILFVVDNSGSMGGEQGSLARSFGTFIDVLEAQQVGANYRIGVTTTDNGGRIRATSCRARLDEFVSSNSIFGDKDERQRGCLTHCALDQIELGEPWVEKSNGKTNLPPGVTMAEALQCIGPQGISGFGFEAPLESMREAVLDQSQGFLRDDALLAVIFVTDEADCSMSEDSLVFLNSEGWEFWTSPERPTSGVCWSAGVECSGGPGVYDDCVAVDKNRDAMPTTDPDEAVLYPVQRYIDTLTDLAATKQLQGGQSEVLIAVLSGVPIDYPETGEVLYADSPDVEFNWEYGIGPGCGLGTETLDDPPGIPSVRLREFAESFATEGRNIFSICADDYGVALQDIAGAIGEISERACVNGCVHDERYDLPQLQPACSLVETFAAEVGDREVAPCVETDWGWDFPDPQIHVCYRALTDQDASTPTGIDDMSAQCVTLGSNLELVIERREGVPVPAGTAVDVRCELDTPVGAGCDFP